MLLPRYVCNPLSGHSLQAQFSVSVELTDCGTNNPISC